jgi:hypothetical protein
MGDMGNDPSRESSTCGHPVLNTLDHTQSAEAPTSSVLLGDQYAARHNPFVYFHSIIDSARCDTEEYLGYAGQPGLLGLFDPVTSDISTRPF